MVIANNSDNVAISTDATSANAPSTVIARDVSGNFSAGTISAALTGSASLNVLKTGDTMTGNLSLANQSQIQLQDATSGNYVGLNAPTIVPASYTFNLPASSPTAGQVLQATAAGATQWASMGAAGETYYVSLTGNDSNDGSFGAPFRTVMHAVNVADSPACKFGKSGCDSCWCRLFLLKITPAVPLRLIRME